MALLSQSILVLGPGPLLLLTRKSRPHRKVEQGTSPETGMAALETFDLEFVVRILLGRQNHSEDVGQRELNSGNWLHM